MLSATDVFTELRAREFSRLDAQRLAYLDYAGSALYAESQLRAHHAVLASGVFGNPHSDSVPSRASTALIDSARDEVLHFLGVDSSTHDVCFTANTTAAVKLVAESYPFRADIALVLSADNHNSINGIREYARRAGARVRYVPLDDELRLFDTEQILREEARGLFAFPAQSNFSGVRHPLELVRSAKALGFDVLVDAAAFLPSQQLNLREVPADFVALSFYKIFGYPTGLGALVARHEALAKLRRPWFAGGTVMYASTVVDTHRLRPHHDGFEDGTPDFLSIAALPAGFALMREIGMTRISAHVTRLTAMFIDELRAMRHVRIYGPSDGNARGATIAFNVRGSSFGDVELRAAAAGVAVRGGCFCNPGASEAAFGLTAQIGDCFERLGDGFTIDAFAACTDATVGAVRVSLGLANNEEDVRRAVAVVASFR